MVLDRRSNPGPRLNEHAVPVVGRLSDSGRVIATRYVLYLLSGDTGRACADPYVARAVSSKCSSRDISTRYNSTMTSADLIRESRLAAELTQGELSARAGTVAVCAVDA